LLNFFFEKILLQAPSAWQDAHPLRLRTPGAWADGLGVGQATHTCPHFMLQSTGALAGRGSSMQTPGFRDGRDPSMYTPRAGSATPCA